MADSIKWKYKLIKMLSYKYREDIPTHIYNIILNPIPLLSIYNSVNIMYVCGMLNIMPKKAFVVQSEIEKFSSTGQDLIADIVEYLGGDIYYSGTGAKNYMDEAYMDKRGIDIVYQDTSKFPNCSIIEYILNNQLAVVK